ncbi:MAG: methylase, partial [Bacteroidales bacterium]|nr:methylase [Bacteroidales bacterium]
MAINNTQKQAAKAFVQEWTGKGYEKGETQRFWLSLLHTVFGIDNPMKMMEFELPVRTITKEKGSDFIDAYITPTKVLIEQKGSHVDLNTKYRQSDGAELSPYQQARRYAAGLPHNMNPRWIVACNFTTFEVHDMEHPNDDPEIIQLADLEKDYHRLSFLVDDTHVHLKKELEVSIQAGEIVGMLYDKILAQYKDPSNPESQKSLNKLCVRLVFCLYAEDAGIFGTKDMFHNYMQQFEAKDFRKALIELFQVLDTKPEDRDEYMEDDLAAFPYVNGGMFAGDIEIPRINDEIRELILQRASDDFDWSLISPTIFGAVFESTLNPATRRAGGMHYTSIENIHKVIDPLFLDELKAEMADIKATSVLKVKKERASAFQNKISGLKFFDPACGSGNFLTESYTCLRRLENEALRIIYGGDRLIGEMADPIKVSINQFYGIEINDFACSVAQTALWIAESQMMQETDAIVGYSLNPLPLKTYNNIHEGNALRMDWN